MKRGLTRSALAVWLAGTMAGTALAEEYLKFMEGPAQWIATKDEKKEFAKLTSEAAARAWVELFWARRDPDLNTAINEFKVEFDQRVAAADQAFGWEKQRGALTDRGRTFIVLGRPRAAEKFGSGDRTQRQLGEGSGWMSDSADRQGEGEVWEYRGEQIPPSIKAQQVLFFFVESRPNLGDFVLNRTERRNTNALKLLAEAPERTLLHPKLTEVPRLGLVAGSKSATAQQLAVFSAEARPWPEGAQVLVREGLMSALMHPVWVHLFLPDTVPAADEAVGQARGAAGAGGTFVMAAAPLSVPGGRAYEFSIPVDAGTWEIDLALLKQGAPLAVTTVSATTDKVPEEGTYISPFYWGVDVRQEAQAHLGDPFNVGGWRILPRLGDTYTTDESLAYFCFIVRPPVTAEGQVNGELTLNLFFGDRKVAELPTQNVTFSPITEDLWMMGSSLPLKGFRRPGEYRLEITLKELGSGVSKTVAVPMTVKPAQASES
ncbi:MAG: GWxTD domain-containing protein [Acidobacteriota bacterium]|jgi:GWxTD domain-containing protein